MHIQYVCECGNEEPELRKHVEQVLVLRLWRVYCPAVLNQNLLSGWMVEIYKFRGRSVLIFG